MATLTLVVTNAGRAAIVNAQHTGTAAVTIATVGVTATAFTAAKTTAALPGEIKRIATIAGSGTASDTIHVNVEDDSADSYTVRGIALYLSDGTLFASYGQPDIIVQKAAAAIMLLPIDAIFADIAASALTFGNANFLNPAATNATAGIVELATPAETIAGTDALRVVTPAGAKAAYGADWRPSNDGAGSGLDADLLDGLEGSAYARVSTSVTFAGVTVTGAGGQVTLKSSATIATSGLVEFRMSDGTRIGYVGNGSTTAPILFNSAAGCPGYSFNATPMMNGAVFYHASNDGAGSGLDADLLDGHDGSDYALLRHAVTFSQVFVNLDGRGQVQLYPGASADQTGYLAFLRTDGTRVGYVGAASVGGRIKAVSEDSCPGWVFDKVPAVGTDVSNVDVVTFGNDGAGSGLDADLLRGLPGSSYAVKQTSVTFSQVVVALDGRGGAQLYPGASADQTGHVGFLRPDGSRAGYVGAASVGDRIKLYTDQNCPGFRFDTTPSVGVSDQLFFHEGNVPTFFAAALSANGYQKLPSGLILQWVSGATQPAGADASQTVTFPIAFPNACLGAWPSCRIPSTSLDAEAFYQIVGNPGKASCTVARQSVHGGNDNTSSYPFLLAIGY